jgi:hypothetical protein
MEDLNKKLMKKHKYHILYKTTNLINNKFYIGIHSSNVLIDNYLGSGKDLIKDIKKDGKENFKRENLYIYETREEVLEKEKQVVDYDFLKRFDTYNKALGGSGGILNKIVCKHKDDNSEKPKYISLSIDDPKYLSGDWIPSRKNVYGTNLGNKNPMFGKKHSEETKRKISEKNKEVCKNEKARQKRSEVIKNFWNSLNEEQLKEYKEKMSLASKKAHSEYTYPKISDEGRKNISEKAKVRQLGKKRGPYKEKTIEQKKIIYDKLKKTLDSWSDEKKEEIKKKISESYRNMDFDKKQELIKKRSIQNSGDNNPMFGKNYYSIWVEKYGIDEANRKQKEVIEKSNNKKNKNKLNKENKNG